MPRNLPLPNQPGAARQLAAMLKPMIEANNGRCLCSAPHAMMRDQRTVPRHHDLACPAAGNQQRGNCYSSCQCRKCASGGNQQFLGRRRLQRGDTLSLVIIDKLPFTLTGRSAAQSADGRLPSARGRSFDEVQLPDAVITPSRVGRLIRDVDDRGVLVICDNRLVMRPNGATFLASLPPAPRTRDIKRAVRSGQPNGGVICPSVLRCAPFCD